MACTDVLISIDVRSRLLRMRLAWRLPSAFSITFEMDAILGDVKYVLRRARLIKVGVDSASEAMKIRSNENPRNVSN